MSDATDSGAAVPGDWDDMTDDEKTAAAERILDEVSDAADASEDPPDEAEGDDQPSEGTDTPDSPPEPAEAPRVITDPDAVE